MNEVLVHDNCDMCCECINICPNDVIGIRAGKITMIDWFNCTFCEDCVDICPNENLEVEYDI